MDVQRAWKWLFPLSQKVHTPYFLSSFCFLQKSNTKGWGETRKEEREGGEARKEGKATECYLCV